MRFLISLFLALPFISFGQISGYVNATNGDTLSFASIYVQGSSTGTSTNLEGDYALQLPAGNYDLVFQYVGYQTKIEPVKYDGTTLRLDVALAPDNFELNTITISADAEDPAYAIIRKAQEKRKHYRDKIKNYSCDVYVKGNQKILSIPEKIMGQEVGDLDGMLVDSSRKGIVYLSETISNYYVKDGESKEIIVSSKVSGNDNGYSFNSAQDMAFNIYDNTFELNREIVSPIADNAMVYYKYKLEGTKLDEHGNLINKIKVIPKRESDPAINGNIYIIEDFWNVQSVDVSLTPQALQLPFMDSINLHQIFVEVDSPDYYALFSNSISFELNLFGIHLKGLFAAVYSDYDLAPIFEEGFFNNEVYKVEAESNKRTDEYWDTIRPIPLTLEENVDYYKKDSIQILKKSPAYLDSVDRVNNKFKLSKLLFGYSYRKSLKQYEYSFGSILESMKYNTVQGYQLGTKLGYTKHFDERETKHLKLNTAINYGFADQQWRAHFDGEYQGNRINFNGVQVGFGKKLMQYNDKPAISEVINEFYSVFSRRNYAKYYDKTFFSLKHRKEFFNGVFVRSSAEYQDRDALTNNADYSLFYKDTRSFTSNNPLDSASDLPAFENHQALIFKIDIRLSINQKYYSYPDRRYVYETPFPYIWFHFKQAVPWAGADVKYTHLGMSVKETHSLGVRGRIEYLFNGGLFLNKGEMSLIDHQHFRGGQTFITNPENYLGSFLMLPYYDLSTNNTYGQIHLQYHFDGYIMDKIPLLNKLAWSLVAGGKFLFTEADPYLEYHVGIDNIGFGLFKLIRLDAVWSQGFENQNQFGWRLGIGFD